MAIELMDKIKPKGGGAFAMVDAADVEMPDGTRLSEFKPDLELTEEQIALLKGEKGDPGEKGDKGDKGDIGATGASGKDGYTPVKGVDYFTDAELQEYMTLVMLQVDTRIDEYLREALEGDY